MAWLRQCCAVEAKVSLRKQVTGLESQATSMDRWQRVAASSCSAVRAADCATAPLFAMWIHDPPGVRCEHHCVRDHCLALHAFQSTRKTPNGQPRLSNLHATYIPLDGRATRCSESKQRKQMHQMHCTTQLSSHHSSKPMFRLVARMPSSPICASCKNPE